MFNAQKCIDEVGTTFFNKAVDVEIDEDTEEYMEFRAMIEEANQCSGGICTEGFDPLYVFSNVNNGVPKSSCHEAIADKIKSQIKMMKAGFVVPLTLTVSVVFVYFAAILYRGYKSCKNYLAKRKEPKKPK